MNTFFGKVIFRLFGVQIIHSQLGEDLILSLLLEGKKDGFYVDIGANHPKKFNNTYLLYKSGWNGINIEPNPEKIAAFKSGRPRDVNLAIGVGPKESSMNYYRFDEDTLNTFDPAFAEKNKKMGHVLQDTIDVPVKPLSAIFAEYLPAGANGCADVMSLDTEGYDMEVLKSNDWNKYRPRFVVIETLEYKRTELGERYDGIFNPYMKSIGYMPVANTVVNTIYQDTERKVK
jgi:FkbM family methyltransferase